jgi:hypothetical protein
LLASALFAQVPSTATADDLNSVFKAVKWRSIGPFRGGRSNAGCGVMTQSGDGVYKSTDTGKTWKHIGLEPTRR